MPPVTSPDNTDRYWRSLAELADPAGLRRFVQEELPATEPAGMTRRRWLQLMGASLALAGVGGCRWEKTEILPFARRPPERTPGVPERYATARDLAGSAVGLWVTCVDGRPIKLEGNPEHPASLGATDAITQAAILSLYDPDRSQTVIERSGNDEAVRTWEEFTRFVRSHFGKLRQSGGAGLRVLAEASSSPTLAAMRDRLPQSFPKAQWHEYEPISCDNERDGLKLAFGQSYRAHFALFEARVIACLDADLLGSHPASVQYARQFARGREPDDGTMSRLYAVESRVSLTGAAADHRLALRSDRMAAFMAILEREIVALLRHPEATEAEKRQRRQTWLTDAAVSDITSALLDLAADRLEADLEARAPQPAPPKARETDRLQWLFALAEDLAARAGRSIVAVGPGQPAQVHAAAARVNAALGNVGTTVSYLPLPDPERPSHVEAVRSLVADMRGGNVHTLLVLGGNPVYNAPADLDFAEAFGQVDTRIHLSLYRNETSRASTWHVPQAHFLESWGDAQAYDGTYSIVQPMIEPLYGGKSAIELLAAVLDEESGAGYDLVRRQFPAVLAEVDERLQSLGRRALDESGQKPTEKEDEEQEVEARWRKTLDEGLLRESEWPTVREVAVKMAAGLEFPTGASGAEDGGPEIVFCQGAKVYDGRFANNGWLQELPDPMTRLTWGNAALVSPATARDLGVEDQTLVKLAFKDRELEMPAYVMPGQADGSVAVQLGYGRRAAGHVGGSAESGVEPVGGDAYKLRTTDAMHFGAGLRVEPTGKSFPLAGVQDHFAIDAAGAKARDQRVGTLIREATLEHYRQHPDFARHTVHHPPLESLWEERAYSGPRWGMTIDLGKCTGCGACVAACQAENNIPIVGHERVLEGREMHWIRVDRYFRGAPESPDLAVAVQPVTCQHCELAPCEQVCPVGATVHDAEGLNVMVYNRCVGTRYCSNNCPYKVRRFNFFNYHKGLADAANEVVKMVYNPEVTVRSRGVMEKCTYCVQRIKAAAIEDKLGGDRIQDDPLKTACQQVCPTGAIVFGDLADPNSRVARLAAVDRSYAMLAELNVKPRTTYLARVRNPNPRLDPQSRHGGAEEHEQS